MLATLANVPTDDRLMAYFSFANADEHIRINQAILATTGVQLPSYVLDPIPSFDFANWLRRHQDAHNRQNAVLGISGQDLSELDQKNAEQMAAWTQLHFQEHYLASQTLGIV